MPDRLIPWGDRLLVRPQPQEEMTASGIHLPAQAVEKPQRGEVLEIGEEVPEEYRDATVLYSKYGGLEVELGAEQPLLVLRMTDVLGRIESV